MTSMKLLAAFLSCALAAPVASPQAKPAAKPFPAASATADRLGLTCAQILAMSSPDWVDKFTKAKGAASDATVHAITAYGTCYDARTSRLASTLNAKPKGPPPAARKEFASFDQALKDFTALALASTNPPGDSVKTAYAALYEKHFRYDFYLGFQEKAATPRMPEKAKAAPPAAASQQAATPPQPTPEKTATELDPLTKAKNHFGELFGMLPDDKIHQVHAAFGKVLASTAGSNETNLAIYRYAIFVLEPPSAQPFSPPPF